MHRIWFLLVFLPAIALADPVTLSLFHPVSTNQSPVHTNLGLGLIYSDVGAVHGVDATLIASRTRGDVFGLHGAGAWSRIDGNFTGGMLVPGVSWVKGGSKGVEIALAGLVHGELLRVGDSAPWTTRRATRSARRAISARRPISRTLRL